MKAKGRGCAAPLVALVGPEQPAQAGAAVRLLGLHRQVGQQRAHLVGLVSGAASTFHLIIVRLLSERAVHQVDAVDARQR